VVAEAVPPKRRRLDGEARRALERIVDGDLDEALSAALDIAGWSGVPRMALALSTGARPSEVEAALGRLPAGAFIESGLSLFAAGVRVEAERLVLEAVDRGHAADPLRVAVPLAEVRSALPRWAPSHLADAVIGALVAAGSVEPAEGGVRRPGHRPELTADQAEASARLEAALRAGGLAPPFVEELPGDLLERPDLRSLLRRLEQTDVVRPVADGFYVVSDELERAAARVSELLGGRRSLGPADFRDALPVSRKWLIPLLNYLDGRGVTTRHEGGRDVAPAS
jgi:selenocysteine-specific elongation factor